MNLGLNKSVWGIWIGKVKMTNMQLEIQFWRKEKSSGLERSVILNGERKKQSPEERQYLEVRNSERSPGAERSKS